MTLTTLELSAAADGGNFRDAYKKCACGYNAKLNYQNKYGRVKDKLILVEKVPVYSCGECNEQFMSGSDSRLFAKKLKEAYAENKKTILF
ncbi:YgiT-type zinc finger protein [Bacillus safensis]|uniref:YgiT-type zinc finger protein n=1 Tax=Bacillus safensis TaxID=561879 RepID=UPI002FFEC494